MPDKDILLLDPTTGKPVCRKEFSTMVDQSSIIGDSSSATPFRLNYSVVAAALAGSGLAANAGKLEAALVHNASGANANASSGAGTAASPLTIRIATNALTGIAYATRAANIPTDMNRDDSDVSPAAVKKMLRYVKPVASTGALNGEQTSADAIEVPMLSNFSCNGGTRGSPKFTVPVAGGGSCVVDIGAWGGTSAPYTPGQLVFSGVGSSCLPLPPGLYRVEYTPFYSVELAQITDNRVLVLGAALATDQTDPCFFNSVQEVDTGSSLLSISVVGVPGTVGRGTLRKYLSNVWYIGGLL